MFCSIKRVMVVASAPSLTLLASLLAVAGQQAKATPSTEEVNVYRQQGRGQIVGDWLPVHEEDCLSPAGSMHALLRLGGHEQQIPFLQLGFNRDPSGPILNLGLGQRWWGALDIRWGTNLFYDYQFQGDHQRLGVGTEVQRGPMKLSVNGYLPLSERRALKNTLGDSVQPAQGVDTYIDVYLPRCPWLGFRAVGEWYSGINGIAKKSGDFKEMYYPMATLGANFIPVPLFKVSYDYVIGKQQTRAHRVKLQFTYQFNLPLKEQLQAEQVGFLRTGRGGQLDLVSRRYQGVLARTTAIPAPGGVSSTDGSGCPPSALEIEKQLHERFFRNLESTGAAPPSTIANLRGYMAGRGGEDALRVDMVEAYMVGNVLNDWLAFLKSQK